jgi:Arylsulfotransferase (ASST)/Secretion system C-terminal sorting domain
MNKKNFITLICIVIITIMSVTVSAQTRTVGLFINDTLQTAPGYVLFAPKMYKNTYLINNAGRLIHSWTHSTYTPGDWAYLLPNGNLLRACSVRNDSITAGGGEGGRVEIYNWGDTLIWYYNYSGPSYMQHHDVKMLPNGNVLMLAIEKKTIAQTIAAGFDTSKFQPDFRSLGYMVPDYVIEVQPTYPSGGTIVWAWHVWDHLIQDFDPTKSNYGVVTDHPELIDCDGDGHQLPAFWNHFNALDYNAKFDQIVFSCRGNSEAWVIDHSTTTSQAAGHTGGRYGHGGDLLYRWGNPTCYKIGTTANQKLFQQHDVNWIDSTCPGAGHMICYDNGVGRNYSSIDEFAPPVDSLGFYSRTTGTAFGPANYSWTYQATPPSSMYAGDISGAQRQPNGNTIICVGTTGTFYEVTTAGAVVWKYICPVTNNGPLHWNDSIPHDPTHSNEYMNMVFRVRRYAPNFSGFTGKNMTPGNFIELYQSGVRELGGSEIPGKFDLFQNYPNPFNPETNIKFDIPKSSLVKISVYDMLGREVESLVNEKLSAGSYKSNWNAMNYPSGVYFCRIQAGDYVKNIKMILLK